VKGEHIFVPKSIKKPPRDIQKNEGSSCFGLSVWDCSLRDKGVHILQMAKQMY